MLNNVVLVGRLTSDPEVKQIEDGKSVTNITLAVSRNFKNADGVYDTDFINITLWDGIATNTAEYCHKGDVLGIKGRIQANSFENKDGEKEFRVNVVAEKVTFLSSKSKDELDNER